MFPFLILFCVPSQTDGNVGPDRFVRLIQGQAEILKDVSFVFEGEMRWIGPKNELGGDPELFDERFQGGYLYRKNDAAFLDVYVRCAKPTEPVTHRKVCVLKGRQESQSVRANSKRFGIAPATLRGGGFVGTLTGPQSPHVFFHLWHLLLVDHPRDWNYAFLGWDNIDGRRCLRVEIDPFPRAGGDKTGNESPGEYETRHQYWIDLERGAHVVKLEILTRKKLWLRFDRIVLERFPLPDKTFIWFPVRGRMQSYLWNETYRDSPVAEQTAAVVPSSIRFNQNLPDEMFNVNRPSAFPSPDELRKRIQKPRKFELREEFDSAPSSAPRTDPIGVRRRIEQKLEEADRQAEELQASSPARASWSWVSIGRFVFGSAGMLLVVTALVLRMRSR